MPNPTPHRDRRHTTTAGVPNRGQAARTREVTPVVFVAPADTTQPDGPDGDERGTADSTTE